MKLIVYDESILKERSIKIGVYLILLISIFYTTDTLHGQNEYPYPSLSPKGIITQEVGVTQIQIEYERPSVRGRKILIQANSQ